MEEIYGMNLLMHCTSDYNKNNINEKSFNIKTKNKHEEKKLVRVNCNFETK